MVISGKQQQLHSYNSSKCINDHRRNNEGGSFRRAEASRCRSASFHNAGDCLTTVAQKDKNKEKKNIETRRKK